MRNGSTEKKYWRNAKSGEFEFAAAWWERGGWGGCLCRYAVLMSGHGRGSRNPKLDQWKEAGHHQGLALRVVANLQNELHKARENLHPNKLRKSDKSLKTIEQDLQVVQRALHKSSRQWQKAAQVDFAVREGVRAVLTSALTPKLVSEKLELYAEGESSSAACLPVQDFSERDATSSIRGGRPVRFPTSSSRGGEKMSQLETK